jgi:fluoroacetyl-CoA thioesterase
MQISIFPGLTYTHSLEIDPARQRTPRSSFHSNETPPGVATGLAVAFVEWACDEAVRPYLDAGERSVGTRIAYEQCAAPVGSRVTAEVELIEVKGRKLRFKVTAQDELKEIGRGVHERVVVRDGSPAPDLQACS